jgi:hypothetical protein
VVSFFVLSLRSFSYARSCWPSGGWRLTENQWWARSRKKELIRATPTLGALRKVPMKRFCRCKPFKKKIDFMILLCLNFPFEAMKLLCRSKAHLFEVMKRLCHLKTLLFVAMKRLWRFKTLFLGRWSNCVAFKFLILKRWSNCVAVNPLFHF